MTERVASKRRRRIMKELSIMELGSVDRPAQAPALAVLMKRADEVEKKYKNVSELPQAVRDALPAPAQRQFMAVANSVLSSGGTDASAMQQAWGAIKNSGWSKNKDGKWVKKDYGSMDMSSPASVAQQVQAVDFDTVLAEQEAREAACEIGDELREKWYALQRSFNTIAADETISAADKITAMQSSMQQYIDSLSEQSDEIAESMAKALTAVPAVAELLAKDGTTEGDEPMTDAEKKQLNELSETVKSLKTQLAAATDKEPAKKAADLQKALDEATAKAAELTDKMTKADAEKAEAVTLAGMSDAEKAHYASLEGDAKKAYGAMSPEDRKKKLAELDAKKADANPVVYKAADGSEFRKNDDPRLIAMAKRNDENEKRAAEEMEKRLDAEFSKAATAEPYTFFKGEVTEKAKVLRAVSEIKDEGTRKALTDMLEVGGKAIGAAFKSIGHQDEKVKKSAQDFEKRVSEIQARDKVSKSKAMSKARSEYPDEFAAYQEAGNTAN